MYTVSLQHYYYSGIYAVEIAAGGIDYAGCDMLCIKNKEINHLEGGYPSPIDAVESAIKIQELWQAIKPDTLIWLSYGCNLDMIEGACCINDDGYADGGEAYTDEEMIIINQTEAKEWAQKEFNSLEKCSRCGDILPSKKDQYYLIDDPDAGMFCSENCADNAYMEMYADLEVEEE